MTIRKSLKIAALLTLPLMGAVTACDNDASVASHNLSKAADMFEINRRVVFYNGINGSYMLTIEGRCSITHKIGQLSVTCKVGPKTYKKHYLGLSDNVTYFAEQTTGAEASPYHYRVIFKPQTIIPDIDARGDVRELVR